MASVLKGIGYLIAAIAVLTVLFSGGILIVAVGMALGILVSLISMTLFTASSLKAFFEEDTPKK